ncbi:MAG: DUF748 domain-containing protein [Methylococcales bacterium]|nr:DUF748 domain-containing protein [Methylococcales bacterium]
MKKLLIPKTIKILFFCITGFLLLYSLLGFLVLPAVLKDQLPKIAKEKLNRIAQIKTIEFNPFSMELNLQGFDIKNRDDSDFFKFTQIYINIGVLQSIKDLSLTIDQFLIKQPNASIKRNKKGDFNFTDLLVSDAEPEPKEEENGALFPLTIIETSISDGKFNWSDNFYSKPQQETISPLNITLDRFTTHVDKQSQMSLALAVGSGGELNWTGNLELTPLKSKGKISLNGLQFKKIWQSFLQDSVNFKINKGTELIDIDYQLTETEKGLQFLIHNASIKIKELQLSEKEGTEPVINIPDFSLSGITFDLLEQKVGVKKISSTDAKFTTWLTEEGAINYQALFSPVSDNPSNTEKTETTSNPNDKPWQVVLEQLDMANFTVDFTDKTLATPVHVNLSSLNLNASTLNNQTGASLPFKLSTHVNKAGDLSVDGSIVLEPFSSTLNVKANNLALNHFQPYIDDFTRLQLVSGLLGMNIELSMLQKDDSPFELKLKGDSYISEFITRDSTSNKDFLTWKQLDVKKIDIDLVANSYLIDTINIDGLYAKILIKKDKSMNFSDVMISAEKEDEGSEKTAEKSSDTAASTGDKKKEEKTVITTEQSSDKTESKVTYKVASINITNSQTDFSDKSLILPFAAHINKLKGHITGVSSSPDALIKADLDGRVADLAPVKITGKIKPEKGDSAITLDFKSMPLPLITPYMAEFAGRKIEKGNMSLNLKYDIQKNKLTASNNLLIDRLVLGDKVDNPNATSLPLGLAIALLEDSDGKIKLDVPITGSLDDPQFSVGRLIMDTLVNVLTKIISSPFNAIASLVGSDDDISKITFSAGESLLEDAQKTKLDGLAKALKNRPALKLEIKGAAFSAKDWPPLQAEALNKQLLTIRAEELSKKSKKNVLPEHLKHSKDENQRVMADLFIQKFPALGERSLLGDPQLINMPDGDFYDVAQDKLTKMITPDPQRLKKLAVKRAQAIAKHLSDKEIAIDRVYLLDAIIDPKNTENLIAADLNLTVN